MHSKIVQVATTKIVVTINKIVVTSKIVTTAAANSNQTPSNQPLHQELLNRKFTLYFLIKNMSVGHFLDCFLSFFLNMDSKIVSPALKIISLIYNVMY